jgi:two-component system, OmpR family, sensor histidine kinase PrrB
MRAPSSLRARITIAAVLAVALAGAVAGTALVAAVERDGRSAVDSDLRARVARIAPGPGGVDDDGFGGPGWGARGRGPERLLVGAGTFAQVEVDGQIVQQGGDVPPGAPPVPARDGLSTVRIGGHEWRSLTMPLDGRFDTARLQLLSSLDPVAARADSLRRLVLLIGLATLAVTALAAWGFTTLAVRPLARLRAGAARVSGAEDLSTPLPDDEGPVEVRSLARALNDMLARLQVSTATMERALHATRRFAADAGHELRTPLTGLRANLDTLARNPGLDPLERDALVADMAAEQERIVHLLEGLQALARGEAADSLPREEIELGDLVDAALFAARRRHPAVDFAFDDELFDTSAFGGSAGTVVVGGETGSASVFGWGGGLRLLVDNLLDNAALHGRADGHVRVGLAREDDTLVIRVDDDGAGVDAAERERLLEPFARGSRTTASGTGLGLAIVAQQVALHDGELRLDDSELGGLGVQVRLPATAAIALAGR